MYHIGKNISTASSGDSTGIDFGPIIFSICINDLPLSKQNSETDMYADDTTIWLLVIMCEITCIQQSLQEILDKYTHTDLYSSRGYFHENPNFTIIIADNLS